MEIAGSISVIIAIIIETLSRVSGHAIGEQIGLTDVQMREADAGRHTAGIARLGSPIRAGLQIGVKRAKPVNVRGRQGQPGLGIPALGGLLECLGIRAFQPRLD